MMSQDELSVLLDALPAQWGLAEAELTAIGLGCSSAGVWHVRWNRRETPPLEAYLKVQAHTAREPLSYDRDVLNWLKGRVPVPEVMGFYADAEREALLLQALPGEPASEQIFLAHPEQTVRLLAESLKQLHSLEIGDCPFDLRLDRRIALARERVDQKLVNEDDFEDAYLGRTAESLYAELLATQPAEPEDLVFCHGDACLPNFIVFQGRLSGLIDIGRAGVSDRWQDLSLLLRSLIHNGYGEAHLRLALETYGEPPNPAKEAFYVLLDEFF